MKSSLGKDFEKGQRKPYTFRRERKTMALPFGKQVKYLWGKKDILESAIPTYKDPQTFSPNSDSSDEETGSGMGSSHLASQKQTQGLESWCLDSQPHVLLVFVAHFNKPFYLSFPASSVGKESTCSAGGDLGLIYGWGRSSGEGRGYPLQYSGLKNFVDCIIHGITKSLGTE